MRAPQPSRARETSLRYRVYVCVCVRRADGRPRAATTATTCDDDESRVPLLPSWVRVFGHSASYWTYSVSSNLTYSTMCSLCLYKEHITHLLYSS